MKEKSILFVFFFKCGLLIAQAPIISYPTPNTFFVNETITPLMPSNSGGSIPSEPVVSTLAGTGLAGALDGTITSASFNYPTVVTSNNQNDIIVVDRSNHKIRVISNFVTVSTLAGTGSLGAQNGTTTTATFNYPDGAIMDSQGNVFVTDQSNHIIRKIDINSLVTTFAGSGIAGFQDGMAVNAQFYYPAAMAIDANDNLFIADYSNHRIRKITPSGMVSTIAGLGSAGATDGAISIAKFNGPTGLCLDVSGNVYVADYGNHKIRKIDTNGQVSTVAGSGIAGAIDDYGTLARFNHPAVVVIDTQNNLYVTDEGNHKIRKITPSGMVSTFAGTGMEGANDAIASMATFKNPTGIAMHNDTLIIADYGNHKIRKIITYKYSVSPNLPIGLSLNELTGEISGTPTTPSPMTDYTVSVSNASGSSSFVVSIEVGSLSEVSFSDATFQLYPNPILDKLTINSKEDIKKITVFNAVGQVVKKIIPNQERVLVDFSTFEKGIYFLNLESKTTVATFKVSKE
ncbi:T9SS type A sorting domain-containing protein [Flavobacterium sp. J27]|uniref:T9SS type A sorting domain-containing protein n=1 Tax=Flavobacterium sp. J27 TaxID=2060419 RepID=UPI001030EEC7|nr:T9SS type A sorting domain-containing protein [Flavobacterium sp. J27]